MLKTGDALLVAHRRLFAEDQPRFFTGTVDREDDGIVMATGYSWVRDSFSGDFMRHAGVRTKVFSLVAGSLIVYRLPEACKVDSLEFTQTPEQGLMLRDGNGFQMDLSERYPRPTRGSAEHHFDS
jgi:hypothetical protein